MTVTVRRRRLAAVVIVAALAGLIFALVHDTGKPRRLVPAGGDTDGTFDPLSYDSKRETAFERAAAAGEAHILFARSPGGVVATARRVARYHALIERVARGSGTDAATLEGIVFLESAGRPDVIAGRDVTAAAGLTQILAETGRNLLGMRIDVARSRRLTRKIARAHSPRHIARLKAARRRADARFDPPAALAATIRYLAIARDRLGRDDLAVVSYHMGIGNLQTALRLYGSDRIPYAQLYFDSTPLRHAAAQAWLARLGDDSANYLWKVRAAEDIMRLWRNDRSALRGLQQLQTAKNSAEEVLHPRADTQVFPSPRALGAAWAARRIVALPNDPARLGYRLARGMGQLARRLKQRRALYRGLRPGALALLGYLAAGVRAIAHTKASLTVTSSVRDARYQGLLVESDVQATRNYSLHTTGWAFDIWRRYVSRRQALAFQFMLDRLTALNLIAWVREPDAIHVTVSGDAERALSGRGP